MGRTGERDRLLAEIYGGRGPAWLRGRLLRSGEVAALLQVSRRTVSGWAREGKLPSVVTLGGQRRYPADEVRRLLDRMHGNEVER